MDIKKIIVNPDGLREDQQKARAALAVWYKNPYQRIFNLSGDAGTGKTYLLNTFLREDVNTSVCITAPTHKALKVFEKATGRSGRTFQSIHALRPNVALESFDINNLSFDSWGQDKFNQYSLIVVDECSQVNESLFRLTENRSRDNNCKILYIGDACQIPPIKERISHTFTISNKYNLTEIIRQEDTNPLLSLFKLLRVDVKNGTSTFLSHIKKYPTNMNDLGEGYQCLDQRTFIDNMLSKFRSDNFIDNVEHVRYTGWTNALTNSWNKYIRDQIIGKDSIIKVGDLLTGYKTVVNEYFDPVLINSEDYIVKAFSKYISEDGFAYYRVKCIAVTESQEYTFNIVDHTDPSYKVFVNKLTALYNMVMSVNTARAKYWARYYEFKNMYFTLTKIDITIHGKIKVVPNELDYGYGLTVHKMQGTTVENVAINLVDICNWGGDKNRPIWGEANIELRNKLIYTAISRASKSAILLV